MTQIHKKFTAEQVKVLLSSYGNGHISRDEIQNTLGIGKTRFFALLKQVRESPETFTITYQRTTHSRLSRETEDLIRQMLLEDQKLVKDKEMPVKTYNYAALADRLVEQGVRVSTTSIIKRAKQYGCYIARKRKKDIHDREVLTSAVGDLIQHDASLHKWSPFASEKWTLITSLDDHSRMLLYADLVEAETSWAHIQATQSLMQQFGVPFRYYVDNLRVFRFVRHRDSAWKKIVLGTDDVITQWRRVLALMKTEVVYALSPQAKGKIERPYRWLQDRIVRTCALENISSLADARSVLLKEVHRYNYHQVHSTTHEIPAVRFEKAQMENRSLFRPFTLPKPFSSPADVFCIQHHRIADGYRRISISGHSLQVPKIDPREDLDLHFIPDEEKGLVEIRIWTDKELVHSVHFPIASLRDMVHF